MSTPGANPHTQFVPSNQQQSFILRATRDDAAAEWLFVVKSVDDALPHLFANLEQVFQHIQLLLTDQ